MKTVARGRSEEIDSDLLLIKKNENGKRKRKSIKRAINCVHDQNHLLMPSSAPGYNREGSKEAADILLQYVQGDANQRHSSCNQRFISNAFYL